MISNNNRKCCRSGYFVGILTYINHRLIHIFCDIEAGGIIRVLWLNLRYGYAVICCRADAVIAGHIHAVLKGRTGRCVKYLHIKGDYYAFACSQITHQHGQRVTVQLMQRHLTIQIHVADQLHASRKRVVCHDVFPRRSSLIAIFDRDLIGEHIANISFGHARGLSYNRVGFALVDLHACIRKRRLLVAIRQNSRIDDKFALHTLVYRHIKGVHHLRIRCDCVRRERQRA